MKIVQDHAANGMATLRISGFIDAHTFKELETEIASLFSRDVFKIVADLSEVEYMSLSGVGVFIRAMYQTREHGGTLALLNPSDTAQEVIEVLGLTQALNVVKKSNRELAGK